MTEMDRFGFDDADRADDESHTRIDARADAAEPSRERDEGAGRPGRRLAAVGRDARGDRGGSRRREHCSTSRCGPWRSCAAQPTMCAPRTRCASGWLTLGPDEAGARGSRAALVPPARGSAPRRRRLLAGVGRGGRRGRRRARASACRGTSGSPTVAQAAALATRPATLPAPRHAAALALINRARPGCRSRTGRTTSTGAVGARTDTLAGRTATTVFYVDRHGRRLAYAIVSGAPLPAPSGARSDRA